MWHTVQGQHVASLGGNKPPIGDGLHRKTNTTRFVGTIYMLNEVLPISSRLSLTFQQGKMAFANIKGGIERQKFDLDELLTTDSFLRDMEESKIFPKLHKM